MRFSKHDLTIAVGRLSMCRFFPTDEATRAAIGVLLAKICPSKEALNWLVDQFVNQIGEWRGPVELRGVLCWRYKPADGIEASASISGYRPEDGEAQVFDQHQQLKAGGWAEEAGQRQLAASSLKLIEGMKKEWPQ